MNQLSERFVVLTSPVSCYLMLISIILKLNKLSLIKSSEVVRYS